jgi:hypothetical protein
MTRHTLEAKTVKQIKAANRGGFAVIRARYVKAMEVMGYSFDQARACWNDVWDVAELESRAS